MIHFKLMLLIAPELFHWKCITKWQFLKINISTDQLILYIICATDQVTSVSSFLKTHRNVIYSPFSLDHCFVLFSDVFYFVCITSTV